MNGTDGENGDEAEKGVFSPLPDFHTLKFDKSLLESASTSLTKLKARSSTLSWHAGQVKAGTSSAPPHTHDPLFCPTLPCIA